MLRGDRWQPAIDVFETEKAIVVRVELAGVRGQDVRVTVDGEWLRIRGERRPPADADVLDATTTQGASPKRPYSACSRSACSVLVGMPVLGPARWMSTSTSGSSTMMASVRNSLL